MRVLVTVYRILLLFRCVKYATASTNATSGPYRSSVVRIEKCEKTTYPIDSDPPLALFLEVHSKGKNNFLRGNLTVFREHKQIKLKLKSFIWQNGNWKLTYLINHMGCHGVLIHMMAIAMGLKYDRENCGFLKGQYYINDVEPNAIQHIWASTMDYGRILWTSEVTSGSTTYYCWEFETLVEPL